MTLSPAITIRPATRKDSEFIYRLSMDESVRAMSTRSDEFTFEQHQAWYQTKLTNGLNRIWIMEVEGIPVAQVRYGRILGTDSAEIAISVVPSERKKGYAKELLAVTEPYVKDWGVNKLIALVLIGNGASSYLFARAGFKMKGWVERMGKQHQKWVKDI